MTKFNNRAARKILVSFIGSKVLTIRGLFTLVAIVLTFSWLPDGSDVINFEDAIEVYKLLENQYKALKEETIREKEIIIDVTGGQKIISIASCIFALPNDREIQYVSTTDYKVKSYDIRYHGENR